jgi:RNA polymerase sigma factor (TIGR02999 family)
MSQIRELLAAIDAGDSKSASELLPIVYDELRRVAAQKLALEQPGQTLQPTDLVHEAYLKLLGPGNLNGFQGIRHFFTAAAEAMRRVLVERARSKSCIKRGGNFKRGDLNELNVVAPEQSQKMLELNEALDNLADVDAQAAELVKLRYFGGMTIPEAAAALEVAPRTADLIWAYARSWLLLKLEEA